MRFWNVEGEDCPSSIGRYGVIAGMFLLGEKLKNSQNL